MSKKVIILTAVLMATLVWIPNHRKTQRMQVSHQATVSQVNDAQVRIQAAQDALAKARRELSARENARQAMTSAIGGIATDLAKTSPESQWTLPPTDWPQWNTKSPYVWIRKQVMPDLPTHLFSDNGSLLPEIGGMLALSASDQRRLNDALTRVSGEFRKIEADAAKKTDEHLSGVNADEGNAITVKVLPKHDDAERLKKEYEQALMDGLGTSRGELVINQSRSWIDSQFNDSETEPRTITLARQSNGYLSVAVRSLHSWTSSTVPGDRPDLLKHYIPEHLLPLFGELLSATTSPQ